MGRVEALTLHCASLGTGGRRTGSLTSLAGGTSESRRTHTIAILRDAGAPILAGAGVATVGSPEALRAGQVAAGACGREKQGEPGLPHPFLRVLLDTFPGVYTPNSTVGLGPGPPECSPVQPAWHQQCP